jgi:hypothetical protein
MLFELPDLPAYRSMRNVFCVYRQRHAESLAVASKLESLQWWETI